MDDNHRSLIREPSEGQQPIREPKCAKLVRLDSEGNPPARKYGGRPLRGLKQTTVMIAPEHDRILSYIGDGNRSAGLRKLVEMYVRLANAR